MKTKGTGKLVGHSAKKLRVAKHRGVVPIRAGKKKLTPKGCER